MKNILKLTLIMLLVIFGCTDLDVPVYSEITSDNFFKTEKQVLSAAGPAYTSLKNMAIITGIYGLNILTTDELLIPTRGQDWDNGGVYRRLHMHEWLPTEDHINLAWSQIYDGVANCNRAIFQYEQVDDKSDALISVSNELLALRGFYYFMLLDLYGNVPLVERYDVEEGYAPTVTPRSEIFDFVESALTESITVLNPTKDITTYGRFHKWTAFTLLAKLYLNAEVYTGADRYQDCVTMCDSVIASGLYTLPEDYFSNFIAENEGSEENIFVVPFDNLSPQNWTTLHMHNTHLWTLHGQSRFTFNCQKEPWNGICGVPSFYHTYDPDDIRRNVWLTGQQFSATGDTLYAQKGMDGQPLNFTVDFDNIFANEVAGARIAKYDYTDATNGQLENDFVIFRYADVLLMKAEALMRINGGVATQEAVDLANQVRARAFPNDESKLYTTETLDMNALLAERGWELCSEGWRRNDLIRFGKYNDPLDFRPNTAADYYNLFPIPQNQINANPNLDQNPGY